MKESYYIYNNEAIACCAILSVLKKAKRMSIAKLCLVLPFLLDDRTVSLLSTYLGKEVTIKELVSNNSCRFSSFNQRFKALLPVLVNSIMILHDAKLVKLSQKVIKIANTDIVIDDYGERLDKINQVSSVIANMLDNQDQTELYKILKIQL